MSHLGSARRPDAVVVGGGLVGLCCAAALAGRGIAVLLLGEPREGEASPAAGGMLAPSLEAGTGLAHRFAIEARDRYPAFVREVVERTGVAVPVLSNGILQLAVTEAEARAMRASAPENALWLDADELRREEPAMTPAAGALLHSRDGAVDNVALLRAVRARLATLPNVVVRPSRVASLELGGPMPAVRVADGTRHEAPFVVLAAGAWVGTIDGLPRPVPVEPVRGQMVSFAGSPLHHVTYGANGYAIPRGGATVVGSTMERVGFRPGVTDQGLDAIYAAAAEIAPAMGRLPVRDRWSGLRPVTPDLLPIVGADPEHPGLLYACGHSRNGILLAPLTGDCIAELATGAPPALDLTPFAVTRFAATERSER